MAGLPKKYAKMGFKKGWREYKKTNAYKSKHGGTTTRRKTRVAKKKQARKASRKLFGNMSIKGIVLGGAVLAGVKTLVRAKAPQLGAYTPGVSALSSGVVAQSIGIPGASLKTYGAIDVASEAIIDLINPGGLVTLPGMGRASGSGGYQY